MPYQLVARGAAGDIGQLDRYQGYFPEGAEGYVEIELRSQVAVDLIGWLDDKLEAVGVPASAVKTEGRFVRVFFKTEIAPLVLIAGAIAACIFLVALVIAWKLFKLSPAIVTGISTLMIVLIVGGILLVLFLIATRGRLAAGPVTVGR